MGLSLTGGVSGKGGMTNLDDLTVTSLTNTGASIVSGAESVTGTLGVTSTTTLSDTVNFNNPGICINFYATSTATRLHMVASTTATIEGVDGVMLMGYGSCAL
jgi:hypothetical protein